MDAVSLWKKEIFKLRKDKDFSRLALKIFRYQAENNPVYAQYLNLIGRKSGDVASLEKIPFLPVDLFKNQKVVTGNSPSQIVFESSGTTGQQPSCHYVADVQLYQTSFTKCFELFFGSPSQYAILTLLPSYLEKKYSSLVFMADALIKMSKHPLSGFFLDNYRELSIRLKQLEREGRKTILIGVAFALLDFAESFPMQLKNAIIIETGGMKGRRKEVTRSELHAVLEEKFRVQKIYSEYGMTELLSQAYSMGDGIFNTPPWMKILIRNPYDPFEFLPPGETGAINIVDLANIHSCAFVQTDDLGKLHHDGTFEVLGRMDSSELRGCNLMVE